MDDEVDRLGDEAPHGELRQARVRLGDVVREPLEDHVGGVRVDRRQRSALAHRRHVEHVERLVLDQFADDHPVGIEPAGEFHELAGGDLALAFRVRVPREQRRRVGVTRVVLEPQFEQVLLDRDDPLERRHRAEQFGEQCGLAGAGRTRHQDREAAAHERTQLLHEVMREQPEVGEPVEADLADDEAADRQPGMGRDAVLVRCHRGPSRPAIRRSTASVSIGDDVSRRPSPVRVIRNAIRFWNAVSSTPVAHSWPTSTLRPSV